MMKNGQQETTVGPNEERFHDKTVRGLFSWVLGTYLTWLDCKQQKQKQKQKQKKKKKVDSPYSTPIQMPTMVEDTGTETS